MSHWASEKQPHNSLADKNSAAHETVSLCSPLVIFVCELCHQQEKVLHTHHTSVHRSLTSTTKFSHAMPYYCDVMVDVCIYAGVGSEGVGVVWSPFPPSSLSSRESKRGWTDIPPMGGLRLAGTYVHTS